MATALSMYATFSSAQLSQTDKNYMHDLNYIEEQPVADKLIQDNIKRQPVLADYFSMAIRKNEIILSPFADQPKLQVISVVQSLKDQLQYDSVNYVEDTKNGTQRIKVHLVYKVKPNWMKSNAFD